MGSTLPKLLFGIICTLLMVYFHLNCVGCAEYYDYVRQNQTDPFWYSPYSIPMLAAFFALLTGVIFLLDEKNRILAFVVSIVPLLYIILIPTGWLTQLLK